LAGVRLSFSFGFRQTDIEFLRELPPMKAIEIYTFSPDSLQALNSHRDSLEAIGLQLTAAPDIDFAPFAGLRVAKLDWHDGMQGVLGIKNLEYLNVMNYPFQDLSNIVGLENLRRLSLTSKRLTSLSGIEHLHQLESLDLYACPRLESLRGTEGLHQLKNIEIDHCKRIETNEA
jgi:Leucine-rich repeat (LRR) protein